MYQYGKRIYIANRLQSQYDKVALDIKMAKIFTYLEKLNLSETESKLYTTLLASGPQTVRDLSRRAGIGRTTSYPYIDLLLEKGLISKIVKGVHTYVTANPPKESLQEMIAQKFDTVSDLNKQFPNVLQTLNALMPQGEQSQDAEIKYYRGLTGIKKIYDEALKCDEFRLYVNLRELASLILPNDVGLDMDLFEKAFQKNPSLKIFEIISDTPEQVQDFSLEETSPDGRYQYKFMPSSVGLTAPGILLYNNNVAIINGGVRLSAIVLHNPVYYVNSKKMFDYIWSTLPIPSSQ